MHNANGNIPLEAPYEYMEKFSFIEDKGRQTYAGKVLEKKIESDGGGGTEKKKRGGERKKGCERKRQTHQVRLINRDIEKEGEGDEN